MRMRKKAWAEPFLAENKHFVLEKFSLSLDTLNDFKYCFKKYSLSKLLFLLASML